jgi:hypothetical protein
VGARPLKASGLGRPKFQLGEGGRSGSCWNEGGRIDKNCFPTYFQGSMTDSAAPFADPLDLREKIAHIDQMLADIDRSFAQRDRLRQEIGYAP